MSSLGLAQRLARRELRGGVRGFRVFLACLALGVAAIATVGALSSSITASIGSGAKDILGGDVALTRPHRDLQPDELRWIENTGRVSRTVHLRAMAHDLKHTQRSLVELKAVDGFYPLYGALGFLPDIPRADVFVRRDGAWGAAVASELLHRLGVKVGGRITIGKAIFRIRAVLHTEPDRAGNGRIFGLGPRVMVSDMALPATGLILSGSLVRYSYRVRLKPGQSTADWRSALARAFPDSGWRVRDLTDAAPSVTRFVRRTELFMTLVGLTALLVGGVGIGNAVGNYLNSRTRTIATLKCLGAPSRLIFQTYLALIAIMTLGGIIPGLIIGAAAPIAVREIMSGMMPVDIATGFYPLPLALAAAYGALTALAFSLWPLARARDIPAGQLFRDLIAPVRQLPGKWAVIATVAAGGALAALAIYGAHDRRIALWFVGGSLAALVIFRIAGWAVMRAARFALNTAGGRIKASFRLALANLHRPGAPTVAVVMSLGLGLTVLVAITLIEGNMRHQIVQSMPSRAPDFFFIDIQPDQVVDFDATINNVAGVTELRRTPILRGRITAINGTPVARARILPRARWMVRGDRGLTWSRTPPDGTRIIAGKWWLSDYSGKPLVSLSSDAATGFGIGVGDTLTVNILGRKVTATVANLRHICWRSLRLNFVLVFSPGVIEAAPQTQLATVRGKPGSITAIERAVTNRFANISAIRVRDVLKSVGAFLDAIAGAIRFAAGVTLLAGALVLAGAVASGHRRRVYDSVVLKVLGATRRDVLAAYLTEYGLLGLATGAIAIGLGTAAAWWVVRGVMNIDWIFLPWAALGAAGLSTGVTLVLGFAGAWRALGRKAAPLLRNE